MAPRRFLWIVAVLVVLVLAAAVVWRVAGRRIMDFALAPTIAFDPAQVPPAPDYRKAAAWVSRPGNAGADPARWAPAGFRPAPHPAAALFFVPPTAFLESRRWNAPLDDADTNARLDHLVRMQASLFNGSAEIWVPRYRQATLGAFLKPGADADRALAVAYGDVVRAFDAFLAAHPGNGPVILAGHSQGSRHLLRLLHERGAALRPRLVAVYVAGWPVALDSDVRALGLPPCTAAGETGCFLAWQSFAADGDIADAYRALGAVRDLGGRAIGQRAMACTNPLTGGRAAAGATANAGTLIGEALVPHRAGARCDRRGLLLIDPAPADIGPLVLPGGNYHMYDYALFWANLRADAEARLSGFAAAHLAAAAVPPAAPDDGV